MEATGSFYCLICIILFIVHHPILCRLFGCCTMNVYPEYSAIVMYEYKLDTKVGTALAGCIRWEYQALVHSLSTLAQVPAQGRSGRGDITRLSHQLRILSFITVEKGESWYKVLLLLWCHLHWHLVTQLCCDLISVQNNSGESGEWREGESLS